MAEVKTIGTMAPQI